MTPADEVRGIRERKLGMDRPNEYLLTVNTVNGPRCLQARRSPEVGEPDRRADPHLVDTWVHLSPHSVTPEVGDEVELWRGEVCRILAVQGTSFGVNLLTRA